jgi:hypothetical protein
MFPSSRSRDSSNPVPQKRQVRDDGMTSRGLRDKASQGPRISMLALQIPRQALCKRERRCRNVGINDTLNLMKSMKCVRVCHGGPCASDKHASMLISPPWLLSFSPIATAAQSPSFSLSAPHQYLRGFFDHTPLISCRLNTSSHSILPPWQMACLHALMRYNRAGYKMNRS